MPGVACLVFATAIGSAIGQDVSRMQALEQRVETQRRMLADWPGLNRYGSEDAEIPAPKAGENRVVFIGDDVIDGWPADKFFPGKPYYNRGIAGQTTAQMLLRFRQDVIALKPKVVVIHAGSSDVASVWSPMTQPMTAENIETMAELARVHGIRVVLSPVTPVCECAGKPWPKQRPPGKLIGLNGWIKDYAAQNGLAFWNIYPALAEGRSFKKDLTLDGLVPNEAGYAVMAPLAEQAIAEALRKPLKGKKE